MKLDIGLAVEKLMGVAEYGINSSYKELKDTWKDDRPIPTLKQLEVVWEGMKEEVELDIKLEKAFQKEKDILVWDEVKKNKDGDLINKNMIKIINNKINKIIDKSYITSKQIATDITISQTGVGIEKTRLTGNLARADYVVYDWRKNGVSIEHLNIPFKSIKLQNLAQTKTTITPFGNPVLNRTGADGISSSYDLNGSKQYFTVDKNASDFTGEGQASWCIWFEIDGNKPKEIIDNRQVYVKATGSQVRVDIHREGRWLVGTGGERLTEQTVDGWNFLAVTYDNITGEFNSTLNGVKQLMANEKNLIFSQAIDSDLFFGKCANANSFFKGAIEKYTARKGIISDKQIEIIYNKQYHKLHEQEINKDDTITCFAEGFTNIGASVGSAISNKVVYRKRRKLNDNADNIINLG